MFRENLVIFFRWILDFKCKKCGIYFGLNTTFVESFFFWKSPKELMEQLMELYHRDGV